MTKEIKAIINRDIKKYRDLVQYSEGEAQDVFSKVLTALEKIVEEQEVQMNRKDLKDYRYNQIWIEDQTEYIKTQKETINRLNSMLSDMPKRNQNSV